MRSANALPRACDPCVLLRLRRADFGRFELASGSAAGEHEQDFGGRYETQTTPAQKF
jgi:hypothetical protein